MVPVDGSYGSRSTLLSMGGVQYVSQAMDQEFIKQGKILELVIFLSWLGVQYQKRGDPQLDG